MHVPTREMWPATSVDGRLAGFGGDPLVSDMLSLRLLALEKCDRCHEELAVNNLCDT